MKNQTAKIVLFSFIAASILAMPILLHAEGTNDSSTSATAPAPKKHGAPFHGTLADTDTNAMTITGGRRTFQITSETHITKNGKPGAHPLTGREMRALRRLQREQSPPSAFVFTSERGSPFSTAGFYKLVARAGAMASLGIKVHPHMLRHATGFDLANRGTDTRTLQDYLGHRNIQHTVRYTELAPHRFKDLWSD